MTGLKIANSIRKNPRLAVAAVVLTLLMLILAGIYVWRYSGSTDESNNHAAQAEVSEDGTKIKFPENSPGLNLIKTIEIRNGETTTRIIAPARVVMSVIKNGVNSSILFESSEMTSLYSQYRQSRASLDRTRKNFQRVRNMFSNSLATSRELSDAEGEMLSAQAVCNEFDVKLRAEGFNPNELISAKVGTSIIIADVPESQLDETTVGEQVNVILSSFQNKVFAGTVVAIGDIIDPTTRTVKVRVASKSSESFSLKTGSKQILRPGMFGTVDFGYSQNSVNIPIAGIVTVEEQNYVFVATSAREFERRAVSIINNDARNVIVQSGLSENEKVVISGAMLLKGLSFGY